MGTPDAQPYDQSEKIQRYGLENMNAHEREKLERTAADAERLAGLIRNYVRLVDFCTEKGIPVTRSTDLSDIRLPGNLADPVEGDIAQLSAKLESGQLELIGHIPHEFKEEVQQQNGEIKITHSLRSLAPNSA